MTTPQTWQAFRVDVTDGIADVQLTGPGKGNAMGPDFWRECPAVFRALDVDDSVRVVIVRGAGRCFSFGLDLLAMAGELGPLLQQGAGVRERERLLDVIGEMQAGPDAVFRCRKPVIAAIHSWCIGGAIDLVTACDVAMVADIGTLQRLPHIIGEGHARELAMTGKDIDAAHAKRIGLVNDVFADDDALLVAARAMAADIAANPPHVVQGVKRMMNARIAGSIADGLRQVAVWNAGFLASLDLGEAMAAFAEKRAPKFEGH